MCGHKIIGYHWIVLGCERNRLTQLNIVHQPHHNKSTQRSWSVATFGAELPHLPSAMTNPPLTGCPVLRARQSPSVSAPEVCAKVRRFVMLCLQPFDTRSPGHPGPSQVLNKGEACALLYHRIPGSIGMEPPSLNESWDGV